MWRTSMKAGAAMLLWAACLAQAVVPCAGSSPAATPAGAASTRTCPGPAPPSSLLQMRASVGRAMVQSFPNSPKSYAATLLQSLEVLENHPEPHAAAEHHAAPEHHAATEHHKAPEHDVGNELDALMSALPHRDEPEHHDELDASAQDHHAVAAGSAGDGSVAEEKPTLSPEDQRAEELRKELRQINTEKAKKVTEAESGGRGKKLNEMFSKVMGTAVKGMFKAQVSESLGDDAGGGGLGGLLDGAMGDSGSDMKAPASTPIPRPSSWPASPALGSRRGWPLAAPTRRGPRCSSW